MIYSGQLSIVATLVSLYPLTTVVLATTTLREQLTWQRVLGVLLALSGIGLLVSGS
ncbi:EamA family transporter [Paraburkholderia sp. GAS32]|uniref:EamA family transporter n=1 Tax=Paraburkholderia sp. GAS32 TaxID=3035129 RepID=UPI003D261015